MRRYFEIQIRNLGSLTDFWVMVWDLKRKVFC